MGTNFLAGPVVIGQGVMVLNYKRVDLDCIEGMNFFRMRVVKPSLETFRVRLDGALSNLI